MTATHDTLSVQPSLQFYPSGVEPRRCTVPGCFYVHHARDMCFAHYSAWYNDQRRRRYPLTPPPRPTFTPYRLSVCQARVAGLLIRGMTNAAIATAMRITANTVKRHLTTSYSKLGVTSRWEAMRLLWPYRSVLAEA